MPGKSRRDRARRSAKSKKSQGALTSVARQQVSVDRPAVSAAPAGGPTQTAKPSVSRYPYMISEMRRIGFLAAVMIAILVILSFVLP
ncbi:hypothetical protein ACFLYR_00215 [Chloroflexota bacterium]